MSLSLKSSVKAALRSWTNYAYNHYADVRDATRILKSVESYRGKTESRDLKLCDEYAVEVLGHKRFAPWLYVYTAVSGRFKEGWVPGKLLWLVRGSQAAGTVWTSFGIQGPQCGHAPTVRPFRTCSPT